MSPSTSTPQSDFPDAFTAARALGRGVNLGDALEAPKEGDWGVVAQEEYFDLIKEAGFGSVRIPDASAPRRTSPLHGGRVRPRDPKVRKWILI
jgi:aryl-phospho-beta-D-glucosidase BglC (GH1 family)